MSSYVYRVKFLCMFYFLTRLSFHFPLIFLDVHDLCRMFGVKSANWTLSLQVCLPWLFSPSIVSLRTWAVFDLLLGSCCDWEYSEFESCVYLLYSIHLSSHLDKRIWFLDPSGEFSCKYFCQFLFHFLNRDVFPLHKPLWKSKAPSTFKSFIWIVVVDRMLQVPRPH